MAVTNIIRAKAVHQQTSLPPPEMKIVRYIDGVAYERRPGFFGIGYRWKRTEDEPCPCCVDDDE